MPQGVPLTPDILTQLKEESAPPRRPQRYSDSTQFLLFLVAVASVLLSAFPLLLRQNNAAFGTPNSQDIIPVLNPSPTPDSSLLFFINHQK